MTEQHSNPFCWLPKPGESKKIPGGAIWCESWEVNQCQQGMMDGEIRFRFQVDAESYREAMQPEALTDKAPTGMSDARVNDIGRAVITTATEIATEDPIPSPANEHSGPSSGSGLFLRITDLAWELYVLENHIRIGSEDSANYWHKMSHEDQICYAFAAGKAAQNAEMTEDTKHEN